MSESETGRGTLHMLENDSRPKTQFPQQFALLKMSAKYISSK